MGDLVRIGDLFNSPEGARVRVVGIEYGPVSAGLPKTIEVRTLDDFAPGKLRYESAPRGTRLKYAEQLFRSLMDLWASGKSATRAGK